MKRGLSALAFVPVMRMGNAMLNAKRVTLNAKYQEAMCECANPERTGQVVRMERQLQQKALGERETDVTGAFYLSMANREPMYCY